MRGLRHHRYDTALLIQFPTAFATGKHTRWQASSKSDCVQSFRSESLGTRQPLPGVDKLLTESLLHLIELLLPRIKLPVPFRTGPKYLQLLLGRPFFSFSRSLFSLSCTSLSMRRSYFIHMNSSPPAVCRSHYGVFSSLTLPILDKQSLSSR